MAQSGAGGCQGRGCPGRVPAAPSAPRGDGPGWQRDPRGCRGHRLGDVNWSPGRAQFTERRQRFIGLQMLKAKFSGCADSSTLQHLPLLGMLFCASCRCLVLGGTVAAGGVAAGAVLVSGARLCLWAAEILSPRVLCVRAAPAGAPGSAAIIPGRGHGCPRASGHCHS